MARESGVQSQIESYQKLKKWYLLTSCLTLMIIRYVSRVKWSNPGKGVAPSPTPPFSIYCKGSLRVALEYGHQRYFLYINILKCCFYIQIAYKSTSRFLAQNSMLDLCLLYWTTLKHTGCGDFLVSFIWFNGISTIVGYLIPNLVYTYRLDVYDL